MPEIKSCGVLVTRGPTIDSFLLMIHPDRYDLPKGHVDDGETDQQCALRELEEETGITVDDIQLDSDFRFVTRYKVRDKRFDFAECDKTLVIFLGRLTRDVPIRVTEHQGFQWTSWDPPHNIQQQTIDPLLRAVEEYLRRS